MSTNKWSNMYCCVYIALAKFAIEHVLSVSYHSTFFHSFQQYRHSARQCRRWASSWLLLNSHWTCFCCCLPRRPEAARCDDMLVCPIGQQPILKKSAQMQSKAPVAKRGVLARFFLFAQLKILYLLFNWRCLQKLFFFRTDCSPIGCANLLSQRTVHGCSRRKA